MARSIQSVAYGRHISFFAWLFFILANLPFSTQQDKTVPKTEFWGNPTEPMTKSVLPKATVIVAGTPEAPKAHAGDIIINGAENVAKVSKALIESNVVHLKYPDDSGQTVPDNIAYGRSIRDSENLAIIGYLVVDPPSPDPKGRFDSLAKDPRLDNVPKALRPVVDPAAVIPEPGKDCKKSECVVFIPSADVFYPGPKPTNTGCLAKVTGKPAAVKPPHVKRDPSLIYVVYANLQVFNMCRDWIAGGEGPLVTMSFKPDEVSTIPPNAPTAAAKFNFGDLPCPPSNLANYYDPKKWYDPILKSDFNFTLGHEKIKGQPIGGVPCHVAAIRDPPTEWIRMDEFSGTDFGGF